MEKPYDTISKAFQDALTLPPPSGGASLRIVTVNPVAGIGVPNDQADTPPSKRFFCVRNMASPLWAGRVGLRKQRRNLIPVRQPARFRSP